MPQYIREALESWFWEADEALRNNFLPSLEVVTELAETLFFASLTTEEKEPTRVGIVWDFDGAATLRRAFNIPGSENEARYPVWNVLPFTRRPLDVATLMKAAPLAEFGRSFLVAGGQPGQLYIDGVARQRPLGINTDGLILFTDAPGAVSVVSLNTELFRYEAGQALRPSPHIFQSLGPVGEAIQAIGTPIQPASRVSPYPQVVQSLASAMSRTRHGGLLLFLPGAPSDEDLEGVKLHVTDEEALQFRIRRVNELQRALGEAPSGQPANKRKQVALQEQLADAWRDVEQWADMVGRLTAVDNAVLIGPGFRVLGAQCVVPSTSRDIQVDEVHDVLGKNGHPFDLKRHGSRHRAAAAFASRGEGHLAILSSADGPLRCFLRVKGKVLMWQVRLLPV
jgi:hypothetical protein